MTPTNVTVEAPVGPHPVVVAQIVIFVLTFVLGVVGNTLVIYVVARYSKMQTVTNMYIVNLAVADECFLLSVPVLVTTMLRQQFVFGGAACKLYYICTSVNQFTSSTLLLIISVDRYIAVCHSVASPRWRTPLISKVLSAGAWCYSVLLMIPIIKYADIEVYADGSTHCVIIWEHQKDDLPNSNTNLTSLVSNITSSMGKIVGSMGNITNSMGNITNSMGNVTNTLGNVTHDLQDAGDTEAGGRDTDMVIYTTYLFITAFVIPFTLILVFYCLIIRRLLRVGSIRKSKEKERSNRKVTRLVMTVIAVYILCNTPYWVNQMYITTDKGEKSRAFVIMSVFFYCLNYANPAFNPLIYAFLSDNFRKSFARAFTCLTSQEVDAALQEDKSVFPVKRGMAGGGAGPPGGGGEESDADSSVCRRGSTLGTAAGSLTDVSAELLDRDKARLGLGGCEGTLAESTSL